MEIGKQIRKYRTVKNMSQEELAEKIFVSRQTISNWENDKNYPDIKSLLLLSSLFDISLDTLVKGDLEEMKEQISEQELAKWNRDGAILGILFLGMIITPFPLVHYLEYVGVAIWIVLAVITIMLALRIEKLKKKYDIQTYKEIIAFSEGKQLGEMEKQREYGKRPYQKVLLAVGSGLVTLAVCAIIAALLGLFQ
uniref:helix-turn-helix domain-containing protein n=1 Tax=Acetatifactor sp. TaxID=1872090 RepID=UPI00405771F7